ncbi:unnamed protein product [Ectocarpus sp. CCAP 1310/34]|nr:unnamed protein product [Ectocarpus sp. CCAP 1310/34]
MVPFQRGLVGNPRVVWRAFFVAVFLSGNDGSSSLFLLLSTFRLPRGEAVSKTADRRLEK